MYESRALPLENCTIKMNRVLNSILKAYWVSEVKMAYPGKGILLKVREDGAASLPSVGE